MCSLTQFGEGLAICVQRIVYEDKLPKCNTGKLHQMSSLDGRSFLSKLQVQDSSITVPKYVAQSACLRFGSPNSGHYISVRQSGNHALVTDSLARAGAPISSLKQPTTPLQALPKVKTDLPAGVRTSRETDMFNATSFLGRKVSEQGELFLYASESARHDISILQAASSTNLLAAGLTVPSVVLQASVEPEYLCCHKAFCSSAVY